MILMDVKYHVTLFCDYGEPRCQWTETKFFRTCAINFRKYSIHQLHPQGGTMDLLSPPSAVEVFISLTSFWITWTHIQQRMDMLLLSNKAKRARSRNFASYGFIVLIGSPSPVSRSLSSSNLTLILLLLWFCSVTRHRAHTPLLAFFSEARVSSWTWIRESQGECSKGMRSCKSKSRHMARCIPAATEMAQKPKTQSRKLEYWRHGA